MTTQTNRKASSEKVETLRLYAASYAKPAFMLAGLVVPTVVVTVTFVYAGGINGTGLDVLVVAVAGAVCLEAVKAAFRR